MSRRRLIVAGAATFLLGLIVLFPARVALHWLAPPGLAVAGIEGSVWGGHAQEASLLGVYLRDLRWRWLPGQLLRGRLGYALDAVPGSGFLDLDLGVGPGGSVDITDLKASVPVPLLESVVGMPGLEGTANLDFPRLSLRQGWPHAADGTVEVAGLVVPMAAPGSLGRYRAEFQTQDGQVVAAIQDDGGVVDLTGRLQLGEERAYDFLGYVAATSSTPPPLARQLQFLGSPDAQGRYELRLSGRY